MYQMQTENRQPNPPTDGRVKRQLTTPEDLPNQSYNLKEVQVILGQDCYDIHYLFDSRSQKTKLHDGQ